MNVKSVDQLADGERETHKIRYRFRRDRRKIEMQMIIDRLRETTRRCKTRSCEMSNARHQLMPHKGVFIYDQIVTHF
jgi:hypothetical protein